MATKRPSPEKGVIKTSLPVSSYTSTTSGPTADSLLIVLGVGVATVVLTAQRNKLKVSQPAAIVTCKTGSHHTSNIQSAKPE
jgi:hypothetical protein